MLAVSVTGRNMPRRKRLASGIQVTAQTVSKAPSIVKPEVQTLGYIQMPVISCIKPYSLPVKAR